MTRYINNHMNEKDGAFKRRDTKTGYVCFIILPLSAWQKVRLEIEWCLCMYIYIIPNVVTNVKEIMSRFMNCYEQNSLTMNKET